MSTKEWDVLGKLRQGGGWDQGGTLMSGLHGIMNEPRWTWLE